MREEASYKVGMAKRIALFGGSFDPIHCGHLIVAREIAERFDLGQVVFLPSASPPHKPSLGLADAKHRAEMVKRAIADERLFTFSDFDLDRSGPTYTIDTVHHFVATFGSTVALHWIIGADTLPELSTWHRLSDLVDACRIITAPRPKKSDVDWNQLGTKLNEAQITKIRSGLSATPLIDISATQIRERVGLGRSIRYLVPEEVRSYIEEHALYGHRRPRSFS